MNASPAAHPTDDSLHAYGLGRLDDVSAASVKKHLESCLECRRRVAVLAPNLLPDPPRDIRPRPNSPAASSLPPGLADHPDYEVIRELGRGGMGVVYLAQNKLMGRKEVLKVVGSYMISRPEVLERFLREIRSAARLHHTNIVTAYSVLRLGESLVLAMEYVEGDDLARIVKTQGPLPVAPACHYIYQAALGLQHAHEHGMVHRDIKPANLMLTRAGKKHLVKVLDFGLAKVTSEGPVDTSLTREGQMLGTPDYIAPEQIRNAQAADIRADIYSLGCTFYYLLTGGPPFGGETLWDLYQAHFSMDATPLNLVRPEVPVALAALVAKMMAKDPSSRFQTPGEVAKVLVSFFQLGTAASEGSNPAIAPITSPETRPGATGLTPVPAPLPSRPATERARKPPPLPGIPSPPLPAKPTAARPPEPPPLPPGQATTVAGPSLDAPIAPDMTSHRILPAVIRSLTELARRDRSLVVALRRRIGRRELWIAGGVLLLGLVVYWEATWLKRLIPEGPVRNPAPLERTIQNTIGMTLTLIQPDGFQMGSPDTDPDAKSYEKPQHRVQIPRPFYLGVTEVTRGQFRQFVDEMHYKTEAEGGGPGGLGWNDETATFDWNPKYTWLTPGFEQKDDHPVVLVSWNDAIDFAKWLSWKEGKTYRLPTEEEWEYACRAGTTTRYWSGDDAEGLAEVGNIADGTLREKYPDWPGTIAARDNHVFTAPVRTFRPNPWGWFDVHGNVWEWCSDDCHTDHANCQDWPTRGRPAGVSEARHKVCRGGSWSDRSAFARSAASIGYPPDYRIANLGFRLVLEPPKR